MGKQEILPPGKDPRDPRADVDAVAGHLASIKGDLVWIDQYRLNLEHALEADPDEVESQLVYLRDATKSAMDHMQRLTELLLAGHTIDSSKEIPKDLELPRDSRRS
jgi:hypothetical protein